MSDAGTAATALIDSREPSLQQGIDAATRALLERQRPDGHFVFELEADATIPAEYVLLEHFLDRIDSLLACAPVVWLLLAVFVK